MTRWKESVSKFTIEESLVVISNLVGQRQEAEYMANEKKGKFTQYE